MSNVFYAHSGGVTSVLNLIASEVVTNAKQLGLGNVYIGKNGILGAIHNELYDTSLLTDQQLKQIADTPASVFGSCRYKLQPDSDDFQKIFTVFAKHNIRYVIYNGGNDSQDTTLKLWQASKKLGYELQCVGLPKTIDNDLMGMDCCPGFGSAAKYIAISTLEAALDVKSMSKTSTKVFVLEVMGRHAGWLAAASSLAQTKPDDAPHIILMPEVVFDPDKFTKAVDACVKEHGYCVVVASEGIKTKDNNFLSANSSKDAFGHQQLGGVAPTLASLVSDKLGHKHHWAVADYLQRSAGHIRSECDTKQAKELARAAVNALANGVTGKVFAVERLAADDGYNWHIVQKSIDVVANQERTVPQSWISENGMHVTQECIDFMRPWIAGESVPKYANGIPQYFTDELPLLK